MPKGGGSLYPVSEAFLEAVKQNTRRYYWTGRITTKTGVIYNFGKEDIVKGSGSITAQCCGNTEIELGTVYAAELDISLFANIDRYTLKDALVEVFYHLKVADSGNADPEYEQTTEADGIYETIPMGIYEVSEANRKVKTLEIKAYDFMVRFEKSFNASESIGNCYDFMTLCSSFSAIWSG